eukprot:7433911-Pyramimonas_sp.AAC.1
MLSPFGGPLGPLRAVIGPSWALLGLFWAVQGRTRRSRGAGSQSTLEQGRSRGLLGRPRVLSWNPAWPFSSELGKLLGRPRLSEVQNCEPASF